MFSLVGFMPFPLAIAFNIGALYVKRMCRHIGSSFGLTNLWYLPVQNIIFTAHPGVVNEASINNVNFLFSGDAARNSYIFYY